MIPSPVGSVDVVLTTSCWHAKLLPGVSGLSQPLDHGGLLGGGLGRGRGACKQFQFLRWESTSA